MNTVDEKVLRKVRKALALAGNNPNESEAQAAMMMAQSLMAKYGIEMSEVENGEQPNREITEDSVTELKQLLWWELNLAVTISNNFKCYAHTTSYGRRKIMFFYGKKTDVTIAKEVYSYARVTLDHLSKNYMKFNSELFGCADKTEKQAIKNDYIAGFLQGLKDMFQEQVEREGWGLILVKDNEVVQAYENRSKGFGKGRKRTRSTANNSQAQQAGYQDGKSFNSDRKVIGD